MKLLEAVTVTVLRSLSRLVQAMPLETALACGHAAAQVIARIHPRRRIAYVNLKAAFGNRYSAKERKVLVQKNIAHLSQNAVEMLRFSKMDLDYYRTYITFVNRERYEQAIRDEKGAVLMTAHFGNWELTQIVSCVLGKPLYVLARQQKHAQLDDFLNELRSAHGSVAIPKGNRVRDLVRVLRANGVIGALGDLSGGRDGARVRFFGRRTTAPSGIFWIAQQTGSLIFPCFMVRENGAHHRLFVEEPFGLASSGDEERDVHESLRNYYRLLETWILRHPDQWFWLYKRWKYCFTKRILILRDDRPGHQNQVEAIVREFEELRARLSEDYEFEFQRVDIKFKSAWHRRLFFIVALFFLPFAQSRLHILSFFLEPECARILRDAHADLILSAGSSLAPLNLVLKRENLARSIAVMKPPFPYGPRGFDLSIIPAHDRWFPSCGRVVRTVVSPSRVNDELLQKSGEALKQAIKLKAGDVLRMSVFIGGSTGGYRFEAAQFRKWLGELKSCSKEAGYDLLVTTSRRTDPEMSAIIKGELAQYPSCKLLVIATESNLDHVVYGMLALSEVAVVTEDSVSMISDAVRAGKRILVLQLGNGKLSRKHKRFQETLASQGLVNVANVSNFRTQLEAVYSAKIENVTRHESKHIQESLRSLL
ncbi:MAG: hypothetical protein A3G87_00590 [Omnitrophica bacterium RIFCSPLOWO2_12_FULL_50_11]|nr:MAG: hypothetical protein A3G87_00590 [Omnitrophica bacterium RIFCSPLOWO2_12_FULL_50_11]